MHAAIWTFWKEGAEGRMDSTLVGTLSGSCSHLVHLREALDKGRRVLKETVTAWRVS